MAGVEVAVECDGDGSDGPNSTRALPVVSFAPPIGTQPRMRPQLPSAGCTVPIITRGAMWSKLLVVVVYLVIVATGTIPISFTVIIIVVRTAYSTILETNPPESKISGFKWNMVHEST